MLYKISAKCIISVISYRKLHSVTSPDQNNVKFNDETDKLQNWILIVKHVVARDSGAYECQVSNTSVLFMRKCYIYI